MGRASERNQAPGEFNRKRTTCSLRSSVMLPYLPDRLLQTKH